MDQAPRVLRGEVANAEELRQILRQAELAVTNARGRGPAHVLRYLHMLDAIEEAIPRLDQEFGVDLKPERTRLETLENMTRSRARQLLREVGAGRLRTERQTLGRGSLGWWWYLDEFVAERRQQALRRWGIRAAIVVGLLLVAGLVYQFFLAPPPEQQLLSQRLSEGETLLLKGDVQGALAQYEAALALDGQDPAIHMSIGAIYEHLGNEEKAREHYEQARALCHSEAEFHANLALVLYRLAAGGADTLQRAEQEALLALEKDSEYALAHFALGNVYELQGKIPEAIHEFEVASNLSGDPSLIVLARMRMGMLMQRPFEVGTPQAEGTPR